MLAVIAAQPKQFPCSLDPIPASSSDASAGAGNPATRKAGEVSAPQPLHHAEALLPDRLQMLRTHVHVDAHQRCTLLHKAILCGAC